MLQRIVLATVVCLIAGQAQWAVADETNEELASRLEASAKAYSPKFPQGAAFDAKNWTSDAAYGLIGDPRAVKGGMIVSAWRSFPLNLRTDGPRSNYTTTRAVHALIYEGLLNLHPNTRNLMPSLATHWQVKLAKDGKNQIFRFRINPLARWADGSEVTADDVVATWEHRTNEDRKDPMNVITYKQFFYKPKIISKLVVEVTTKEQNWRNMMTIGTMSILPAKYVRCSGADYIKHYQWNLMMGTGPYHLAKRKDMVDQESLTLTRRKNYWAAKARYNIGVYNFDKVKWTVIRETRIQFEKVKKGDIDWFRVNKAQRWVEECDPAKSSKSWAEKLTKGWVLKRKIYTSKPAGFAGFVFNMRKPPFDNKKVRRAFAYLFNREKLIEKLFFNEYEMLDSYWPAGPYANKANPKIRYNPRRGAKLLADAGYKKRNKDGWLVNKDGKPFRIVVEVDKNPSWERIMTVIKKDYAKHGIDIDMQAVDWRAIDKKISERNFNMHFQPWGSQMFPGPRTMWHSSLAAKLNNNNLAGFKNERIDRYIDKYVALMGMDAETLAKRQVLIQKMDKIIFREYPYALGWYGPYTRILYQNKFGHPKEFFSKYSFGDHRDISALWWIDPAKVKALAEAKKNGTALPTGTMIQRPWEDAKKDGEKE